jgi:hypothetical protein
MQSTASMLTGFYSAEKWFTSAQRVQFAIYQVREINGGAPGPTLFRKSFIAAHDFFF